MKLRDAGITPPGGWRFIQAGASKPFGENTKEQLIEAVYNYRRANGLPLGNAEDEIEDQLCQGFDQHTRKRYCDGSSQPRIGAGVEWKTVHRFLRTAAAWLKGGMQWVPQEEAERRAAICSTCPMNIRVSTNCGICHQVLEEATSALGDRRTSLDSKLQACAVCGCSNKISVHVPLEVSRQEYRELSWPDFCWKRDSNTA